MYNRKHFKAILVLFISLACLITACSSKANSITWTTMYPAEVDSYIDEDMPIQLLNYSDTRAYLIYYNNIKARAFLSLEDENLTIHLLPDEQEGALYEYPREQIFELELNPSTYDTLSIVLNGQSTHFDRIAKLE